MQWLHESIHSNSNRSFAYMVKYQKYQNTNVLNIKTFYTHYSTMAITVNITVIIQNTKFYDYFIPTSSRTYEYKASGLALFFA